MLTIKFLNQKHIQIYLYLSCIHIFLCIMCDVGWPQRQEEVVGSPGTGVTQGYYPSHRRLTSEQSLQTLELKFKEIL